VSPQGHGPRTQLPGLWFNASEIHALLAMEHLIENMQPGLLASHVAPLRARVFPKGNGKSLSIPLFQTRIYG
jgi:hypothetical protein